MTFVRLTFPATALALTLSAASLPAHAAVFATFSPISSDADIKWIRSGGLGDGGSLDSIVHLTSLVAESAPVAFTFLDPSLSALVSLPAQFLMVAGATGTPATQDGQAFTQLNVNGAFGFLYTGPTTTIGSVSLTHNVTNLLSGVFTNAWISGIAGSGSMNLSSPLGSVAYNSDVKAFPGGPSGSEFAFNLLLNGAGFGATPGKALNTFTGNGGGNFSIPGGVPEPAGWMLMIGGFAAVGATLRARRRATLA